VSGSTASDLAAGVRSGDRTRLARAITLVESDAPEHAAAAQELLGELVPDSGGAIRIGVTGVPGAGKSTLIEALGTLLTGRGHRVAVTAVDPSSRVSGGSILGDKTRMTRLASDPLAFVRPSPTGGALGGVTRKTRETILLFEAAGFDVVIVETVGVGQSEIAVRSMVDFFLLVVPPGGGDALQAIKRGVGELADAILVNKADGPSKAAAHEARLEHERALHHLQPATPGWKTPALAGSALNAEGIEALWDVVEEFRALGERSGSLVARREEQAREWLRSLVEQELLRRFHAHPDVAALLPELERQIVAGKITATAGALRLLAAAGGDPGGRR